MRMCPEFCSLTVLRHSWDSPITPPPKRHPSRGSYCFCAVCVCVWTSCCHCRQADLHPHPGLLVSAWGVCLPVRGGGCWELLSDEITCLKCRRSNEQQEEPDWVLINVEIKTTLHNNNSRFYVSTLTGYCLKFNRVNDDVVFGCKATGRNGETESDWVFKQDETPPPSNQTIINQSNILARWSMEVWMEVNTVNTAPSPHKY